MASPARRDVEQGQQQIWSASKSRGGGGAGGQPTPSPAKARQAQRRYRSLFHQAAKEYWAWREGEDDSQRALGSVFHLLDRLRMLEPDRETGGNVSLGGLENLPGCRELLIRKHTAELERVMRLWRALVQQMKGQVSRVEESLAEAWQLYRSDPTRARRRPLHNPPLPSPSQPLPPTPTTKILPHPRESSSSSPRQQAAVVVGSRYPSPSESVASASGLEQRLLNHGGAGEGDGRGGSVGLPRPPTSQEGATAALPPSPRTGLDDGAQKLGLSRAGGGSEDNLVRAMVSTAPEATRKTAAVAAVAAVAGTAAAVSGGGGSGGAGGISTTMAVGAAEYLQWLGDMSSMLVHEQWRKEELLARVAFGHEAEAATCRAHVQANWSSRSADSFLDQSVIDAAIASSQLVPPPRSR